MFCLIAGVNGVVNVVVVDAGNRSSITALLRLNPLTACVLQGSVNGSARIENRYGPQELLYLLFAQNWPKGLVRPLHQ
jgi:hypothetical protein